MVMEGKEIPGPSEFSQNIKNMAKNILEVGPEKWTEKEINQARYAITDICDDLKSYRSSQEMIGSLIQLYPILTNFYFRSQNKWSAKGKAIPKRWKKDNLELAKEFVSAFDNALKQNNPSEVIHFSEKILNPFGGWYFEGSKTVAPSDWRIL